MYGFELKKNEYIDEIGSEVFLYFHTSGARLLFVKNNDDNRVVMPVFKTLPENDKGQAHIVEHCTLCGSENYRLKDPFNVLEKGSLYTYLNAITYEDKTVYPVASTYKDELKKMAAVYADALFKPLFIHDEGIFRREGVCYKEDGVGGVVYNEMKGAFSSEERCLLTAIKKALYSGCAYEFVSAGIPDSIAELRYKELKDFYYKNYSPDNCLIYIYGNVDIEEYMELYSGYLTKSTGKNTSPEICTNEYKEIIEVPFDKTAMGFSGVVFPCCRAENYRECIELSVLSHILTSGADSLLYHAIVDEGGAVNFSGGFDDMSAVSEFHVIAEGMEASELRKRLEGVFSDIINRGIDRERIKKSVYKLNFFINEEDFGYKPKGLFLGLELLKGLMYDDTSFQPLKIREMLKSAENADYQGLVEKYFAGKGIYGTTLAVEKKKMMGKGYLPTGEFPSVNDSPEELNKIPPKRVKDIPRDITWFNPVVEGGCIFTKNEESNIVYLDIAYPINESIISAAALYGKAVLKLNKKLLDKVTGSFGRLNIGVRCISVGEGSVPILVFSSAFLRENMVKCTALLKEIIEESLFNDNQELNRIIASLKSDYRTDFVSRGNSYAISSVMSALSYSGRLRDMAKGIGMYNYLNCADTGINDLKSIADYLRTVKPLIILRGTLQDRNYIYNNIPHADAMPQACTGKTADMSDATVYRVPAKVNFNCLGMRLPFYKGYMGVAVRIAESGYIWDKIRLEGGAYGGGCSFTRNGIFLMYSYRDPMVESTYTAFEGIGQYFGEFDADRKELERFIVGAANARLRPVKDKNVCPMVLDMVLQGRTYERELTLWKELLDCKCSDIRQMGDMILSACDSGIKVSLCGDDAPLNIFKEIYRL